MALFIFPNEMRSQTIMNIKVLKVDSVKFAEYGYFDFLIKTEKGKEHILVDERLKHNDVKFLIENLGNRIELKLGIVMQFRIDDDTFLRHSRAKIGGIYVNETLIIDFSENAKERYYSIFK